MKKIHSTIENLLEEFIQLKTDSSAARTLEIEILKFLLSLTHDEFGRQQISINFDVIK
jgi:hypothetical protein